MVTLFAADRYYSIKAMKKEYQHLFHVSFCSVPNTGYIKLIDIWKIVSMLLPFSLLILHTMIDSLSAKNKRFNLIIKPINKVSDADIKQMLVNEKLLKVINGITIYGIPVSYCIFICVFFIYGVYHQSTQ